MNALAKPIAGSYILQTTRSKFNQFQINRKRKTYHTSWLSAPHHRMPVNDTWSLSWNHWKGVVSPAPPPPPSPTLHLPPTPLPPHPAPTHRRKLLHGDSWFLMCLVCFDVVKLWWFANQSSSHTYIDQGYFTATGLLLVEGSHQRLTEYWYISLCTIFKSQ